MQQIPKFLKTLVKWTPTGVSGGLALYFFINHQWTQAIVSFVVTSCCTLAASFSEGFMEVLKEEFNQQGKKSAESILIVFDSLLTKLRWKLSRFKYQYYQSLFDFCRDLKTEGFKIGLPVLDLEDVFVRLQVVTEVPGNISGAMVQATNNSMGQEIWNFLAQSKKISPYRRIAVLAPAGYGKTTLLQHLTLTYAKKTYRKHKAPDLIPVLVYLRNVRERITSEHPPSLPELITDLVKSQPAFYELNPPSNWFEHQLKSGRCLVMLDGLDEVADFTERQQMSRWVNQQMQRYRQTQTAFIITSRHHGFESELLDEVGIVLAVKLFTLEQVKLFIHNWYLQTEIRSRNGRDDPNVRAVARENAENLIEAIIQNPAIREMASNPLLVTMIATVHYCGDALPGRRVELYRKICEVLLGARQTAKKIKTRLTAEQNKFVLQILALELMQRKTREFTLLDGATLIQDQLAKVDNTLDPEKFLSQIAEISGLLVEKQVGIYEFAHLSFQEYLAAAQVKELQQDSILTKEFHNSWWAETIRLYAAQSDVTNLIRMALKNPTVYALSLAYDCLEASLEVEPATRKELEDILENGLESSDPQITKIAAEVSLSRRLNCLLRIDETLEISLSYITCAEYQLFVDAQKIGEFQQLQPDSLPNIFSPRDARKPIIGVSVQDVNRFCAWLSLKAALSKSGDGVPHYYRLLTDTESKLYSSKNNAEHSYLLNSSSEGVNGIRLVKAQVPPQYIQLSNYLAAGQWREANKETTTLLLQLAGLEAKDYLSTEKYENLSSVDLQIIDQLWMQHSSGRFGFSVQKQIWKRVVGQSGSYDYKTYIRFGECIGWFARDKGGWLSPKKLSFTLDAPAGHLPKHRKDGGKDMKGLTLFSRSDL